MSFEATYHLPVIYRRWLLQRWQKHQDKAAGSESTDKPLTPAQRAKYVQQSTDANTSRRVDSSILSPRRNS